MELEVYRQNYARFVDEEAAQGDFEEILQRPEYRILFGSKNVYEGTLEICQFSKNVGFLCCLCCCMPRYTRYRIQYYERLLEQLEMKEPCLTRFIARKVFMILLCTVATILVPFYFIKQEMDEEKYQLHKTLVICSFFPAVPFLLMALLQLWILHVVWKCQKFLREMEQLRHAANKQNFYGQISIISQNVP